eukprot:SAG22_NODE_886_length_6665_cov_3.040359_8_plen_39_part_00
MRWWGKAAEGGSRAAAKRLETGHLYDSMMHADDTTEAY